MDVAEPHRLVIAALGRARVAPGRADPAAEVVWCPSSTHLRARLGLAPSVDVAVVDGRDPDVDVDLVHDLHRAGVRVVIVDPRRRLRLRWTEVGADAVLDRAPSPGLARRVAETDDRRRPHAHPVDPPGPAPLLAVGGGFGSDVPAVATGLARSLADHRGPTLLVDLMLDAPLRALHGLDRSVSGVADLVAASRIAPPAPALVDDVGCLLPGRDVRLVPGLRRHADWIGVGARSLATALVALQGRPGIVVAATDLDTEGGEATGSFDVEDRNVLARTTIDRADVVAAVVAPTPTGCTGLRVLLERLDADGFDAGRIVLVAQPSAGARRTRKAIISALDGRTGAPPLLLLRTRGPGSRARISRRDRRSLQAMLEAAAAARSGRRTHPTPVRVAPGELGHWGDDDAGWITPSAPQQP